MRRPNPSPRPRAALAAAVLAASAVALAPAARADGGALAEAPAGVVASLSLGGGAELGLDSGKPGVLEVEGALGYTIPGTLLRPELSVAIGGKPDAHAALRPGLRVELPGLPLQLRAALDASDSRAAGFSWRWILVGAAAEVRLTSLLGLYAEVDTGVKLRARYGLPLLARAGVSFRF